MNVWPKRGRHGGLSVFTAAMAGLVAWAFWRFGATWLAAVTFVISFGCLGVALYAWWLSRWSQRTLGRASTSLTEFKGKAP